eukprot:SAG22_NODE_1848_length_3446_cov_4.797132_2_plen_233_part_00
MGDDDGAFRERAMAMYKTRGKKEMRAAAASLKKDVTSTSGQQVEQEDYKALAMKLYKMEKAGDEEDDAERRALQRKLALKTKVKAEKDVEERKKREEAEKAKAKAKRKKKGLASESEEESSSEEEYSDFESSDSDVDEKTKLRRQKDREIQKKKADALRAARDKERLGTGAKKMGNLLKKGIGDALKGDGEEKPKEMTLPQGHETGDGETRTFADALSTKTDAEWELKFLAR